MPPAPSGPPPAHALYPSSVGFAWAHSVRQPGRDPVLVTSRVEASDAAGFTVRSGAETVRYLVRPDGIDKPESGYPLLQEPIVVGAAWGIRGSLGQARVAAVDAEVEVPAGRFRCVIVVEEVFGSQRVEWAYAPNVGPVRMRSWLLTAGAELPGPTAVLVGYSAGE